MEDLKLGKKIQEMRGESGLSLRKTANLAGITPSMLSQIENEQVNPSIQTLRAIAQALDTPLYTFFQERAQTSPVVRAAERSILASKGHPEVRYELLTPDTKGSMEVCLMVIPPRMHSYRDPKSHAGEEVAFVQTGACVELNLDGSSYTLGAGDSVRIAPNTPHVWYNPSEEPVQVLFAVTPPSF